MPKSTIVIIGAGVLGLSTATLLQRRHPRVQIIIIAAELPTDPSPSADYASPWAGAHYRPIPRSTRQLHEEAELGMQTAKVMKTIARETPEAGVGLMKAVEYLESPPPENLRLKTGDVYAGPDDTFRVLERNKLPKGVRWGCEYESYCVNVPMYCRWLLRKFQEDGGRVVQQQLERVENAFEVAERLVTLGRVDKVVNCSGRNFDTDQKIRIIRGQTVLVKQQYRRTVTRQCADGSWAFLIPRPAGGGTIVGGSKEVGDFETRARPETREKLLQEAVRHFPDLVDDVEKFDIVKDNVGRRPWREGGLRMETEQLPGGRTIVHGYGAGGRGYELSWGAAAKIVDLVVSAPKL